MKNKKNTTSFLDNEVSYKTGVKTPEYDAIIAEARRRAVIEHQRQQEEEKRLLRASKWNELKSRAIPFGQVIFNFKLVFILALICFVGNLLLSIIYKNFSIANFYNLFAAILIFYAGKYVYPRSENIEEKKLTSMIKEELFQTFEDVLSCKLPPIISDNVDSIVDTITIISAVIFALFPATNILYAACILASLFAIFLSIGIGNMQDLNSHLKLLNNALLIGLIVKLIHNFVFVSKMLVLDYSNIALLFLYTGLQIWLVKDS